MVTREDKFNMLKERFRQIDEEAAKIDNMLDQTGMDLTNNPDFQELVGILSADNELIRPTLDWLKARMIEISAGKLRALYTQEQLKEMLHAAERRGKRFPYS